MIFDYNEGGMVKWRDGEIRKKRRKKEGKKNWK